MAEEKPVRQNRKRKASTSSVSPLKKVSSAATGSGPAKRQRSKQEKIMTDENKTTEEAATPSQAESKVQSSATHARKAAEDLRSAAGAVAEEYRGRAEEVWNDASDRVRSFQDDTEQYVRENPTKAVLAAVGIGFILGLIFRR
jgi:ElaB/YqjD/DUF883 family membrane-anchored ribosome-binding protein